MMNAEDIKKIVSAEKLALETLDYETQTATTFVCPFCGGEAHLAMHEWLGYTSHCQNGCFQTNPV